MNFSKPTESILAVVAVAALPLVSCSDKEAPSDSEASDHVVHWGYEADDGPESWGSMSSEWLLCVEGSQQSPIDLANTATIELPDVELVTPSDQEVEVLNQAGVIDALDNGHTIQINTKTSETLTVGDETYALVQFHFHAPSEHTVDGEHYPMEMHFVHQADDGALAVASLLIEQGDHNDGIGPLWEQLAEAPGTEATIRIPPDFAEDLFGGDATGIFHYTGSLTTPPCSERVKWYIRKTPTQFSKEQIAEFTAVYDHNNRPVQALNDRTIYLDANPTITVH